MVTWPTSQVLSVVSIKRMANALHIQINDHDAYQHEPLKLDQHFAAVAKVPLIRIYGSLRIQRDRDYAYPILVHVHNYYPYLYVDCVEKEPAKLTREYLEKLSKYLDETLQASFQRKRIDDSDSEPEDYEPECARRFVASVTFCRGTAVYGYHLGYSVVLKILLLLPLYKTRLARLIGERKIDFGHFASPKTGRKLHIPVVKVYEAHIPYLSQFLADFNLYGCGWLEVEKCHFRLPVAIASLGPLKEGLAGFIAHNNVLSPSNFARMGRSLLEIDISTEHILNRSRLRQRMVHNDFSEFNSATPQSQIYLSSLRHTYDDLQFQCRVKGRSDTSQLLHSLFSEVFTRIGETGYCEWESSSHYRELLAYVGRMNKPSGISDPNDFYASRIEPVLIGASFPTCFEVTDLQKPLCYFQKVPLLNFRDDLIRWLSYESLFEESSTIVPDLIPVAPVKKTPSSSEESAAEAVAVADKGNGEPKASSSEGSDEETETLFSALIQAPISSDDTDSASYISKHMDRQLFSMTQQKRPHTQIEESIIDSTSSLLSQTLHFLLRNPKNVWELQIPLFLRKSNLIQSFAASGLLDIEYSDPSYYKKTDVHAKPLVFSNKKIPVPYRGDDFLPTFSTAELTPPVSLHESMVVSAGRPQPWQYAPLPPLKEEIKEWINVTEKNRIYKRNQFRSQIEPAVTQTNDFKHSYRSEKVARNPSGFLNLTQLHLELHVNTNSELKPHPKKDAVSVIFYHFNDANNMHSNSNEKTAAFVHLSGVDQFFLQKQLSVVSSLLKIQIKCFTNERDMVKEFLLVVDRFDPDILSGYEANASSWGYLVERFQEVYETNLLPRLSRSTLKSNGKFGDRWGYTHTSALKINGRHVLNIWRLLRSELSLTSYTIENVCYHLLHQTLPRILNLVLSRWFRSGIISRAVMFFKYYFHKLEVIMKVIDVQELVLRNVEQSRLIGIDFNSNFYRGSQFKVESILLRIAKEENMLLNSPTKLQVHEMRALDSIPLIMEPDSNFYKSPLVVLDFQSLYPSIMIAYNYCYSTVLGKIEGFKQDKNVVGYLNHLKLPHGIVDLLEKNDGINISPNGMMFVTSNFRKSILSRMLQEILNMRINVKAVAGAFREDTALSKLYNSKQLALKLIANVTYGYASATFSGRMPSSDIADAIVSTGREILTKSIELIESSSYNAKVVYGDTDSLFVYFPGRSKEYAFQFGKKLAEEVTEFFPDPIKLKFEKVYHPCVLLAKKRYVGNCFEFENQKVPKFEAKGIETIRRDGIPAQLKMVGKTLRILFETKNLSKVKEYVVDQFFKILFNQVNVQDFCFAKEVRYGTYKNEKYLPPGAVIAKKKVKEDPRSEPQYRERVPYLVIRDATKERIKDRSVTPEDYISSYSTDNPMELDFEYYITRVLIPPLERIFNLMGVNIKEWYRDMPKSTTHAIMKKRDILNVSDFVQSKQCYHCDGNLDEESSKYLCSSCLDHKLDLVTDLVMACKVKESNLINFKEVCILCNVKNFGNASRITFAEECVNESCLVYYSKTKALREFAHLSEQMHVVLEDLRW